MLMCISQEMVEPADAKQVAPAPSSVGRKYNHTKWARRVSKQKSPLTMQPRGGRKEVLVYILYMITGVCKRLSRCCSSVVYWDRPLSCEWLQYAHFVDASRAPQLDNVGNEALIA